jgi:hypothetical protein
MLLSHVEGLSGESPSTGIRTADSTGATGDSVSGQAAKTGTDRGLVPAVSASSTAAAPATTAASRALFARSGFIDGQRSAFVFLFIQGLNRREGRIVVRHLDKSKSLAAASVAILDHLRAAD